VKRPVLDGATIATIVGALLLLGAYALATSAASSYYRINTPQATSFSSAPEGLRGAFEYLTQLGYETLALRRFEELPDSGTIVVATDQPLARGFTDAEAERLAAWVTAGGRLVLIGPYSDEALASLGDPGALRSDGEDGSLTPLLPSPNVPLGTVVMPGPGRVRIADPAWVSIYADAAGSALVVRAAGAGEIVWLADRYAVSNEGIGTADNGELAVRLLAARPPVYFDEYHHGFVAADTALGRVSPGGQAALVAGLLVTAVLLAAYGRRLGPAIADEPTPGARTLAYVESLAELYRTAGARAEALAALAGGLERAVARRHGSLALGIRRRPEAADAIAQARELVRRGGIAEQEFVTAARAIARARREVESTDG